ncbi:MAG: FHA domain-containing protein [Acidobacteria bacterium]|nr:FHA domain-containing protein [Acidobacteriota bacterium]
MSYISWLEGGHLHRHFLQEDCFLGRDPLLCAVANPREESLSRKHAALTRIGETWWVRDLDSLNGSFINGLRVNTPMGNGLQDGDELRFGDWTLTFTDGFPGLESEHFVERVGTIFEEVRPEPQQAIVLMRGLELLQRCTESLLAEKDSDRILQGMLEESIRLFGAGRGFLVMQAPGQGWRTAHRVGDIQESLGLSRTVLDYVATHGTAVLSNMPTMDPRFGGSSLVEFQRGALMCAPLVVEGRVEGVLYLDRALEAGGFMRFDLALLQGLVRQGSLILRHAQLNTRALGQAELEGELFRLKALHGRTVEGVGELLSAMGSSLRWILSWCAQGGAEGREVLRHQAERLAALVEEGLHNTHVDVPDPGTSMPLQNLQGILRRPWEDLLRLGGSDLKLADPPPGQVWIATNHAIQALVGLVEPLLIQAGRGTTVGASWVQEPGTWVLRLSFPEGIHGPSPDPWTARSLLDSGIRWKWAENTLSLAFAQGPEGVPEENARPLMGLVTEEYQLLGLFQSIAESGDLNLFPLEAAPPLPPLPRFRYLVVDAGGIQDPVACIQAYRRHPSFVTSPILVVRAPEDLTPSILAAGATDWLPEGFRWEALHNRLQVLRGHDELQRKALAAERLDSFRQMAGTLKHEINNPLAVISMQVELLQRKYPEEVKLGKIEEMVDRIQGLVQVLQKMREAATVDYADGSSIAQLPSPPTRGAAP